MTAVSERVVVVPIEATETLEATLRTAATQALEETDTATIRLVLVEEREAVDTDVNDLFDRAEAILVAAAEELAGTITIERGVIESSSVRYAPMAVAEAIIDAVEATGADLVVFDPHFEGGAGGEMLHPIERHVARATGASVIEAEMGPTVDRPRLPRGGDLRRYGLVFAMSLGFYLLLAGSLAPFEVITGVASAAVVSATLGAVALWQPPAPRYAPMRLARALVYIPYLLVMILKANVEVARVILHPRLPIEPRVVRFNPAVYGPFPLTTLANSITLTPGTLSMRLVDQELLVHTLIPDAREDLLDGRLERAVRFLFYGRRGMRVASPREREDATIEGPADEVTES